MLKTIFFGTPAVAVPFLEELNKTTEVLLVVTQPDRPSGRGLELKPCAVKQKAMELGLNVISPEKFKDSVPFIETLKADMGLAVAYGKIFRKPALDALKLGIINIHFSLLPLFRGAAPVQHTLFSGAQKTGITAFWIDEGLDSGPIAAQNSLAIEDTDDAQTLFDKLISLGLNTLKQVLTDVKNGKIVKTEQQGSPTLAPMIDKQDTFVSFKTMTAQQIHNKVRGLAAGMPAFAKANTANGDLIQVLKTSLKPLPVNSAKTNPAGSFILIERTFGFFVQCKEGVLFIETIRPSGKKTMPAADYANGKGLNEGDILFV